MCELLTKKYSFQQWPITIAESVHVQSVRVQTLLMPSHTGWCLWNTFTLEFFKHRCRPLKAETIRLMTAFIFSFWLLHSGKEIIWISNIVSADLIGNVIPIKRHFHRIQQWNHSIHYCTFLLIKLKLHQHIWVLLKLIRKIYAFKIKLMRN